MVQIPNDIGLRMRLQAEAALLQPASPITEIASDFPELRQGQRFTARILEALPENSYKALVAGKSLTLSLPESARPGDSLDLVVIDRSPRAVVAQLANPEATPGRESAAAYPPADLSPTGKLIAQLLPGDDQPLAPVRLNQAEPVITSPPSGTTKELATAMGQALQRSGLFYESHQAQWLLGTYPLTALLEEPQAKYSDFGTLVNRLLQTAQSATGNPSLSPMPLAVPDTAPLASADNADPLPVQLPKAATTAQPEKQQLGSPEALLRSMANSSQVPTGERVSGISSDPSATELPGEVKTLVQQQLDLGGTQRLIMHGEIWPRQDLQWEIERDARHTGKDETDDLNWTTRLALTMPRIGEVGAQINIGPLGVRVSVIAASEATAALMRTGSGRLIESAASVGLNLASLTIRSQEIEATASNLVDEQRR